MDTVRRDYLRTLRRWARRSPDGFYAQVGERRLTYEDAYRHVNGGSAVGEQLLDVERRARAEADETED